MVKAAKHSVPGRLTRVLSRLAGFLTQLTHAFTRFASKYPTSNFIGEQTADERLNSSFIFNNDFEQVECWKHGRLDDGLIFCDLDDFEKAKSLRDHFAPRFIISNQYEGR